MSASAPSSMHGESPKDLVLCSSTRRAPTFPLHPARCMIRLGVCIEQRMFLVTRKYTQLELCPPKFYFAKCDPAVSYDIRPLLCNPWLRAPVSLRSRTDTPLEPSCRGRAGSKYGTRSPLPSKAKFQRASGALNRS